jgi:hypothetical protein
MSQPEKINFRITESNSNKENNSSPNASSNKINLFLKFCSTYNFKGFSFSKINTFIKNSEIKKKPILPNWKSFDLSNYSTNAHVFQSHTAFAIFTGKTSNITVIDVDDKDEYQTLVTDFPELKDTLTVETAKGFHIYCKYDGDIVGRTFAFKSYDRIDIRNDNELLFSPPTTYTNCITGKIEKYVILDHCTNMPVTEFVPFPLKLKRDLKQFLDTDTLCTIESEEIANGDIDYDNNVEVGDGGDVDDCNSLPTIVTMIIDKSKSNATTEISAKTSTTSHNVVDIDTIHMKKKEMIDLLNALHPTYCDSWENWFRIGGTIYHELGDSQESKDLFLLYSKQKSPIYAEKVTMTDIDNIWSSFKPDKKINVTKASLYQQCKQTSLPLFKEIQKKHEAFDFFQINSTTLAKQFVKMYGDDFIQNHKMGNLYYWDGHIWSTRVAEQRVLQIIGNEFYTELVKQWKNRCDLKPDMSESDIKASDIIVKKLANMQRREFKMSVFKDVLTELPIQAVDFDTNFEQLNNLQFQNGILMLDKVKLNSIEQLTSNSVNVSNAFRNRTKTDYVSLVLPYDFDNAKKEDIDFVQNIFNQIQPESLQRDFQLGWLAYCLTGNTGAQIFKVGIGYSGSNGKSLEAKIHSTCFDIYSFKLNKNTFTEGNDKVHKQFIHLISKPIRYAYIEELNRKKMDAELLKDAVDGHKLNVEIMYGTSEEKAIQAKISTFSNTDFRVAPDGGILRRGRLQYYPSEFIDINVLEASGEKRKPNQFPLVRDLEKQFLKTEMKLAYLWVLLPYVAKFYSNGLIVPEFAKQNFSSITVEYDDLNNALEEICKKGNEDDKIWKDDLVEQLGLRMNKTLSWEHILPEMKRLGYKYERTLRTNSISGIPSCKGVIIGLKWNDTALRNFVSFLPED